MSTINLLYENEYKINDKIKIVIPKVGDVLADEDGYYSLVSMLTAMPIDMMVQLDDQGIDFTTISEYDLFLMMFLGIQGTDTSLIFGDLHTERFQLAENSKNGMIVLVDPIDDIVIDRAIHGQIAATLRRIHHFEKDRRRPGNEEAKKYMLERARIKMKRKRKVDSQLEQLIVAMVNTEQFKYNYEQTKGLSIYQFNESVKQIIKKIDYDNRMVGVYTGNINVKELSQEDLSWLKNK